MTVTAKHATPTFGCPARRRHVWLFVMAAVGATIATAANGRPSIQEIPLPTGVVNATVDPRSINWNGTAVVGTLQGLTGTASPFIWTSTAGTVNLGVPVGFTSAQGWGVSADGASVSGLMAVPGMTRAFLWTAATGIQNLDVPMGQTSSRGGSLSDDGRVVPGSSSGSSIRAERWSAEQGWQTLAAPPGFNNAQATYANRDGSRICGLSNTAGPLSPAVGFLWSSATQNSQILGAIPGAASTWPAGISADGLVVVGVSGTDVTNTSSVGDRAFRWTAQSGIQSLGVLAGDDRSRARGVDERGLVVVGDSRTEFGSRAILWTSSTGMVELSSYLIAQGTDLSGWTLLSAASVSRDGTAIAGQGLRGTRSAAWIVTGLQLTCRADFNGVGGVTVQDVFDFLSAYFNGSVTADFNGVGGVSLQDIFDFLVAYFAGCP